jgi:hypothetical protein
MEKDTLRGGAKNWEKPKTNILLKQINEFIINAWKENRWGASLNFISF